MNELEIKYIQAETSELEKARKLLVKLGQNKHSGLSDRKINKLIKKLDKKLFKLDIRYKKQVGIMIDEANDIDGSTRKKQEWDC